MCIRDRAAAKQYADTKIAALIGSAPETLDTFQELAEALENNPDVVDSLNAAIAGKVDKVEGSRLMTNEEGTKLSGVAEKATKVASSETNGNILILSLIHISIRLKSSSTYNIFCIFVFLSLFCSTVNRLFCIFGD